MGINLTRKCCHWCPCCISSLRPFECTTKELFGCKEFMYNRIQHDGKCM